MPSERTTDLTYGDLLEMFPEESNRPMELLGGELLVTPSPTVRHQRTVLRIGIALARHADQHGGEAFASPLDTMLTDSDVVQPDVMYFGEEKRRRIRERPVTVVPDLIVEVSSPSTRAIDRGPKRELYARHGVPEYWFVDLESDRVEIHRLEVERYGRPVVLGRGDTIESPLLPGFALPVDEVLGPPED